MNIDEFAAQLCLQLPLATGYEVRPGVGDDTKEVVFRFEIPGIPTFFVAQLVVQSQTISTLEYVCHVVDRQARNMAWRLLNERYGRSSTEEESRQLDRISQDIAVAMAEAEDHEARETIAAINAIQPLTLGQVMGVLMRDQEPQEEDYDSIEGMTLDDIDKWIENEEKWTRENNRNDPNNTRHDDV